MKVVGRVCRTLLLVLFILHIIRHDALHRQALGELKYIDFWTGLSADPCVFGLLALFAVLRASAKVRCR